MPRLGQALMTERWKALCCCEKIMVQERGAAVLAINTGWFKGRTDTFREL